MHRKRKYTYTQSILIEYDASLIESKNITEKLPFTEFKKFVTQLKYFFPRMIDVFEK